MEEHVYPNERALSTDDQELIRSLQAKVKEAGLWAPHVPPEAGGSGKGFLAYAHLNEEIGRSTYAQLVFGCQAPDAGNAEILHMFGTPEQKERWLFPLVAGEIRSFFSMTEPEVSGLRPDHAPDARRARRRRVGDRRAQVVLVGRRRRGVRDRDGRHRPGRARALARVADRRPRRHAGRRGRSAGPGDGPRGQRLVDALRGLVPRRPRAGRERARRAGRRVPDRAEAARPGPHPPRDALARPDAARVRADVRLLARARGVRLAARRQADDPELDRRLGRRHPRLPADDARRRAQDRRGRRGARRGLA